MTEITFSESACGALQYSREFSNVLVFSLFLSIGDISESSIGPLREHTLADLFSSYPAEIGNDAAHEMIITARANLQTAFSLLKSGENLRIWYSSQPDELCGFYWLMAQLAPLNPAKGQITLVKLPEYEPKGERAFLMHTHGWSDIAPEEFSGYLAFQAPAPEDFIRHCAQIWKNLKSENAPLRATVNSHLLSVPEDFYDCFIRMEISRQPETFLQAMVIGGIIGRYGLGIGDAWLSLRMEKMIECGELEVVSSPPADAPIYRRTLKKVHA